MLPKKIFHIKAPPIKCQGIKTKLVNFIAQNIEWDGSGRWIEPFLGSGVVLFNLQPQRALIADTNKHIINLYKRIQNGDITPELVREFLISEGEKLSRTGTGKDSYYYEVRKRFNREHNSLDFLFLSRACFNGMMRFNGKGEFNVPFCRKPDRFKQAYITKIVNQVKWVRDIMKDKDWEFVAQPWQQTIGQAREGDFIYLDPPYIGRHTDYFNSWDEEEATSLAIATQLTPAGFALSMWAENSYRKNDHLKEWNGVVRTMTHFYHVGATENLRNEMQEALVIKNGFAKELIEFDINEDLEEELEELEFQTIEDYKEEMRIKRIFSQSTVSV
jgi:DNA adenine methylase